MIKSRFFPKVWQIALVGIGVLFFSYSALAHPGHGLFSFGAGFFHPMTGMDHLLTALAVGILTVSSSRKFNNKIPFGFAVGLMCGICLGQHGIVLPFFEQGITLSLVLLGICLMLGARLGSWKGIALVACFGLFHGNAHGIEVENGALSPAAAAGLGISTMLLITMGAGVALMVRRSLTCERGSLAIRFFGAVVVGSAFIL